MGAGGAMPKGRENRGSFRTLWMDSALDLKQNHCNKITHAREPKTSESIITITKVAR
jgi:hypothetical protein